mmetsp:Transcript_115145/g.203236  ORF Transcript_115145/g.203236 Transcript_115145/m.203236 type:complete len:269 (+) Transcript_115145:46-852(+)
MARFFNSAAPAAEAIPVNLHIYDVTTETTVRAVNGVFRAVGTGAFHAAVEVLGVEYSFGYCEEGTGVFECPPKGCEEHNYRESMEMKATTLTPDQIAAVIARMSAEWQGEAYDLLRRNCCTFSNALCVELGCGEIPKWVTNLAGAGATLQDTAVATKETVTAAAVIAAAKAGEVDEKYNVSGTVRARAADLLVKGRLMDEKYKVTETVRGHAARIDDKYKVSEKTKDIVDKATPHVAAAAATGAAAASAAASKLGSMFQGSVSSIRKH